MTAKRALRRLPLAALAAACLSIGAAPGLAAWSVGPGDTTSTLPPGVSVDTLLVAAESLQKAKDPWGAAWHAARWLALAKLDSRGTLAAGGRRDALEERARRTLDRSMKDLAPEQIACLAAWWGPGPELSWGYFEAMAARNRSVDAAAEALGFLARYPAHARAKAAAERVRKGRAEGAAGLHQSVYRLAAILPLSGAYETYGRSIAAGLEHAVSEGSGHGALPIRLALYDSRGEPWTAAAQAHRALAEGAGLIVGEVLSVPTLVVAGMGSERGVPVFSPAATEERIAEAGDLVFQTGLSELEQGRALARHAVGQLRLMRLAVAHSKRDTIGNLAAGFTEQAKAWEATVLAVENPSGPRDFQAAVNQLRRERADGLLLPDDPAEAELWVAALRAEGYPATLLGSERLDPQALHPEARADFEGTILVGLEYALPDTVFAALDTFVEARHGFAADAFVRRGYLTGRIVGMALRAGIASPRMMGESVSQRLVEPAPEHPAYRFIRWGDREAVVPIYVVRRGEMVRAQ